MTTRETLLRILDAGRWAPSGDNTQPWRFQIIDDTHVVIHGSDTRAHCVYDLDGHPSQMALGALIETLSIAASEFSSEITVTRRPGLADTNPLFDLRVVPTQDLPTDPLVYCVRTRSVQRRPMSTRALTANQKTTLERSVGAGFSLRWIEGRRACFRVACVLFRNAKLRLTLPEAYQTHVAVIEWGARYSNDRVPDQALGVDPVTARLMRWIMTSWKRVLFFNKYLAGTIAPRIQMDFLPGIACAAHFVILAEPAPRTMDDYIAAGRATQRFWLTASSLGLQMQPELTPLIFSRYAREQISFSSQPDINAQGQTIQRQLDDLVGKSAATRAAFMGRIGVGTPADARSLRRPLSELLIP